MGTIAHEIGHVLGFHHEHSRPDRDEFILVNNTNIQDGKEYNFDAYTLDESMSFAAYDVSSIMHYGPLVCINGLYAWFIQRLVYIIRNNNMCKQ